MDNKENILFYNGQLNKFKSNCISEGLYLGANLFDRTFNILYHPKEIDDNEGISVSSSEEEWNHGCSGLDVI